jgi:hypothetical protein
MKVFYFLFLTTLLSGCSVYKSQGRECLETKSNCAAVDLPTDAFSQSVAMSCNEPIDQTLIDSDSVESLSAEADWIAHSKALGLWLLSVEARSCVYFYSDKKSLISDYQESLQ